MNHGVVPTDSGIQQLQPGTVLQNRYQIQKVIGVGGMGAVYGARDLHFLNALRLVAVKEMVNQTLDAAVRRTIVENFEREANILAALSHPSIPKILDYFTTDQRFYLVLEFVHGKDLEAMLVETHAVMAEEQVIQWAIELCTVLSYLHNHKPEPIVFRDIKPSNIMINQQGHVVLVDFGIAKLFKEGQRGTMIGTEGYSPAEQYRGEASPLADIYSLGATLHHLLTRRDPRLEPPFTFPERPIREINPLVSLELETVINTALQYNQQDRFQSVDAMKEALLIAGRKTGALRKRPARAAAKANEDTRKPLWTFKCEDEVRGTPVLFGDTVFVGAYDSNLYAINARDGSFLWKYPTGGGIVGQPLVSEGIIIFGSEDGMLYAVSARTGTLNWTYKTKGPIRSSPRMVEGHILIGSDDGCLHMVNPATARTMWTLDVGAPIRSTPFNDGKSIYFGCNSGEFFCVNLSGQIRWRFR
ncbi:MAG: serine/threonine-protein kinase, partial [Anaerolineaceae bacterium]|nr:serine/threonine-protein kinase [Anaerolineaceae bacterium]